ncbi:MAG: hypothetical protein IPM71_00870 [Bacteroidota bacterium]|nr:MAG: hypothetical protein IPM71_00870 [Bacteroidota bacterium]
MKNLFLSLILFLFVSLVFAQTPEMLNYQAVVRNTGGELIKSQSVSFRISVLQTNETGTVVYTETHNATTNTQGIVNLKIGSGTTTDNFVDIEWGADLYFLKVEMDPAGGTAYSHYSTTQLLSVPYALNAKEAATVANNAITAGKISNNAVTAAEILDEPGIAASVKTPLNSFKDMPTTISAIDTVYIEVPAEGYVYVTSSLSLKINHSNGTNDEAHFQLMADKNDVNYGQPGFGYVRLPSSLPTESNYGYPVHLSRVFYVPAAGSYTFYLNARMFYGGDTGDDFFNAQMAAMYFPTAYGGVY